MDDVANEMVAWGWGDGTFVCLCKGTAVGVDGSITFSYSSCNISAINIDGSTVNYNIIHCSIRNVNYYLISSV